MDSSGLGVILGRYKLITSKGGKMVVCDVIRRVPFVRNVGYVQDYPIQENERNAMSSLEVAL